MDFRGREEPAAEDIGAPATDLIGEPATDLIGERVTEPAWPAWLVDVPVPPRVRVRRQEILDELGRAMLRVRLFRGWSQTDLELASGVDQTTISRFEGGLQRGLSIGRVAALLAALNVGRVDFLPPLGLPPTALDLMIHGDPWKRAGHRADRHLARRRQRRAGTGAQSR